MKREKEFDRSLVLLIVMMLIIVFTALYLYLQVRTDKMSELVNSGSIVPIMIIVTENDKPLLTEILMFYPETGKGALLDIPGNTGLIIEKMNKIDRIDVLFDQKNVDPFKQKVSDLTDVEIPFYFIISLERLKDFIDLIDGLQLFIANPVDIKIDDETFLLPSGSVNLDGSKMASYLRYTLDGESDSERIDRYQKFMKSFLEKAAVRAEYLVQDDLYNFIKNSTISNMDRKSFENFLNYLNVLDTDRLQYNKAMGVKRFVDNQELLFLHMDEMLIKERVKQIEEYLINISPLSDLGVAFSVEVLNGTDINGLGARTSQVLKSFGYKISGVAKNATRIDGNEFEHTVVLDRKGNPDAAKSLAALLKCERWHSEPDENLDDAIGITLILGKDFDGRYVR